MFKLEVNNFDLWEKLIHDNKNIDIFFNPEYSKINEFNKSGKSQVAIWYKNDAEYIIYPFLIREIPNTHYFDISSPYGYGGFYASNDKINLKDFFSEFYNYCRQQNIIAEFVRFHLFDVNYNEYPGKIRNTHLNLYVDTQKDIELIKKEYHRSVRKALNLAERENVTVIIDEKQKYLDDFYKIYIDTMKRNNASEYYFFKKEYFLKFKENLPNNSALFHSVYNDKIIATELVLYNKKYSYSYLGGSDSENYKLRPNNILKNKIIEWANYKGIEKFILGGGYSKDDGIYRYKKNYTKTPPVLFYVGQNILNQDVYNKLCNEKIETNNLDKTEFYSNEYFPLYRSI